MDDNQPPVTPLLAWEVLDKDSGYAPYAGSWLSEEYIAAATARADAVVDSPPDPPPPALVDNADGPPPLDAHTQAVLDASKSGSPLLARELAVFVAQIQARERIRGSAVAILSPPPDAAHPAHPADAADPDGSAPASASASVALGSSSHKWVSGWGIVSRRLSLCLVFASQPVSTADVYPSVLFALEFSSSSDPILSLDNMALLAASPEVPVIEPGKDSVAALVGISIGDTILALPSKKYQREWMGNLTSSSGPLGSVGSADSLAGSSFLSRSFPNSLSFNTSGSCLTNSPDGVMSSKHLAPRLCVQNFASLQASSYESTPLSLMPEDARVMNVFGWHNRDPDEVARRLATDRGASPLGGATALGPLAPHAPFTPPAFVSVGLAADAKTILDALCT